MLGSGEKILVAALAGCSVLLTAGIAVGMMGEDRIAPIISLGETVEFVYEQDSDDARLLDGVQAVDDEDGDVTDSIIISDITYINSSECVVVYAAKDSSDNVSTFSRKLNYIRKDEGKDAYYESLRAYQRDNREPYLRMTLHGVYVKAGSNINFVDYVQEAVDVDGNDIRAALKVEGVYDLSNPGIYKVGLSVSDAAGKVSNIEEFTITVE